MQLGKQPTGSQGLSTKTDSESMSEVIEIVSRLNEQILQAAVLFGDIVVFSPVHLTPEATKDHAELCCEAVGSKLTKSLASRRGERGVNPSLVRLVLQVLLAKFFHLFIGCWELTNVDLNDFIKGVYSKIRDAGKHFLYLLYGFDLRVTFQRSKKFLVTGGH